MRNGIVLSGLLVALVGCGVNPDRLATMHKKNAEVAEDTKGGDIVVEYSDSDPKAIRDAVSGLKELESNLLAGEYDAFVAKRYEILAMLSPAVAPELETHEKRGPIMGRLAQLDGKLAKAAGERAMALIGAETRVNTGSADALYAIQDAVDSCGRAVVSRDNQMSGDLYRKYEAGLERARAVDASALSYVGPRPSGAGTIDVPIEIALCDAKMALKLQEQADEAPAAADLSREFPGCGSFDVTIEAAQTGANAFGDFQIIDSSQPKTMPAVCEKFPPSSDAPSNVQRAVRDKVLWLAPGDIVSMAGPFEYDQRETLYKRGVARIFRKDAVLRTNRCGVQGSDVTCEAEGSELAAAVNQGQHFLARADFHRLQGNAGRCKTMADRAYKALSATQSASGDGQILLANGDTVSKTEGQARLEALKSQANDALASNWCEKP